MSLPWRILVTGSRDWTDGEVIAAVLQAELKAHPDAVLVVGDAGWDDQLGRSRNPGLSADAIAIELWIAMTGRKPEIHYADWADLGKAAGPVRNHEMVQSGVDICHAFPLAHSRGTLDCMARAEAAKVRVVVHEPGEGR